MAHIDSFPNSILDKVPGPGPVLLPVSVHVVVEFSEAAVPVPRDYVELVRVKGARGEDLLEVIKPGVCLSLSRRVDGGDPEVLASNLEV